ncbi:Reverse transcriptase zinc-binding domain-containing protein [Hirschfeldia incana]|nr:Reverse transcriptase zinc-binding domain-containing protein [Hirschfeldia incana]
MTTKCKDVFIYNNPSRHTTLVWVDPWIPKIPAKPATPRGLSFNPALRVNDLIDPTTKDWNLDLLQELIAPDDIPSILSLKPTNSPRTIGYCWNHTTTGAYSVKTGYALAMESLELPDKSSVLEPSLKALQAKVWKLKTTKKIQHFIWQAISNCIPVCNSLVERHCGIDRNCPRCGAEEETPNHLLFECPPSAQTWALADIPHSPGLFPCSSIYSNLDHVLWRSNSRMIPDNIRARIPWLIWYIWKARNDKAFNGKDVTPLETVQLARAETESWTAAQTVEQAHDEATEAAPLKLATHDPSPNFRPLYYALQDRLPPASQAT